LMPSSDIEHCESCRFEIIDPIEGLVSMSLMESHPLAPIGLELRFK
jgi:hypothetical protein